MMFDGMLDDDETHSSVATSPADIDRPRLVALWKGGAATLLLPERGRVLIGRSASCDLRVEDGSVSREHAVVCVGPPVTLQDLGSSNGTRVGGQALEPGQTRMLGHSAVAQLGETLLLLQQRPQRELTPHAPTLEPEASIARSNDVSFARSDGAMCEVHRLSDLVATGDISVILRGETGAGKEVLAKRIHDQSPRAGKPLLKINCAAFSESMVEGELFGHERGAFTGAHTPKPGLLEVAEGGTVLLDEVGELSLAMQAKLLRAIGNREVYRVGATKPRPIDVRFLGATHRDLEQMISRGEFRADLFFRLNGITITVPPLRKRVSEILPLAEAFLRETSVRLSMPSPQLSHAARTALLEYPWPGNIRELRTVLERALLLCQRDIITPEHLALSAAPSQPAVEVIAPVAAATTSVGSDSKERDAATLKGDVQRLERERILRALSECGGNQTKAALKLGISRRALLHRLDAYGFPRPRKAAGDEPAPDYDV